MDDKVRTPAPTGDAFQKRPERGDDRAHAVETATPDPFGATLSPDDRRALEIARRGMDLYRNALTELAK